jgi:hypothetical protein
MVLIRFSRRKILPVAAKWGTGFILMLTVFFAVSIPFTKALAGTNSTWSVIDRRIPDYFRSLLNVSEKDALKKEDTL